MRTSSSDGRRSPRPISVFIASMYFSVFAVASMPSTLKVSQVNLVSSGIKFGIHPEDRILEMASCPECLAIPNQYKIDKQCHWLIWQSAPK